MDVLGKLENIKNIEPSIVRSRNTLLIELVEGDILADGDKYSRVDWGEISIYADGTVDTTNGKLVSVSIKTTALGFNGTIFNMEDAG